MLTRRTAAALTLLLCLAGCAGNTEPGAAGESSGGTSTSAAPTTSSSAPAASPSSKPTAEPSDKPTAGGAQTVTGTVEAGVEPNCRLIKDNTGSHLLVFRDESLRSQASVGKKITATGRSEPTLMSTCQQGIPFIITSISPA